MFSSDAVITRIEAVFLNRNPFTVGERYDFTNRRDHYELIYKYAGSSEVTYGGDTFPETGGTVRYMPKTEKPVRYGTYVLEPVEYCYFTFQGTGFPDRLLRVRLSDNRMTHVGALFSRMYHIWTMRQPGYEQYCMALAYEILAELSSQTYLPKSAELLLSPALEYIGAHLCEPFPCSVLADLCGVSYSYFKKVFTAAYNMPPIRYVTDLRMKLACEQLRQSEFTISGISAMLGYSDVAYFSRVFKKTVGCSAQEYRRKNKPRS